MFSLKMVVCACVWAVAAKLPRRSTAVFRWQACKLGEIFASSARDRQTGAEGPPGTEVRGNSLIWVRLCVDGWDVGLRGKLAQVAVPLTG